MLKEVTLPGISENVDSGEVIAILVSVGDVVEKDQPVVELETEKAAFEVPAPEKGRVAEIDVKQGQTVKVGEVLVKLQTDGELAPGPRPPEKRPAEPQVIAEVVEEPATPPPPQTLEERAPQPPAVEERRSQEVEPKPPASAVPVAAAPSVRHLARELGLDITEVPGSGPGGRITPEDVKRYARGIISGGAAPARVVGGVLVQGAVRPLPDLSQWGDIERQPMSKTRRTIADTLSYGWSHIPHVAQYDRADITDLESFRKTHAPNGERAGGKLSVTSIAVKIVASALKVFPQFNASLDEQKEEVVYRKYCHIAVAVDTERGLLVPVIRDADRKSISQISVELAQLAVKARNKQITADELMGGCFTVSNLGGLGGTSFAPVVYWPQVAILGIARATWEPMFRADGVEKRLILPLSLSYDHRVIDGADGARFLHWIAQALEQPLTMML
ncbi:MAG: 2-oxo acid dehydrogenase subunit E2 [Planctomycetes bacterium]|nr:2-oxo acid dehydrogenase subunit E2 [Planctomycetota bacterium]